MSESIAGSCLWQMKWRARHALDTTGKIKSAVAGFESLNSVDHRLQPTPADAVDRLSRRFQRQTRFQYNLTCRVHALSCLENIADDYICDILQAGQGMN